MRRFVLGLLATTLMLACSDDALEHPAAAPSRTTAVAIEGAAPIATVSERFLSVAVDTAQVVGAPFWSSDASVSVIGNERRPPYDFARPKLRKLAAELAPAYLRIGGSTADIAYADMGDPPMAAPPEGYEEVLTKSQWDGIADFARSLDYEILFTLNAGPGSRDGTGRWTPDNAREIIEYTTAQQIPVVLWELGNEVNAFPLMHGPSSALTGEEYTQDMAAARALVDELDPGSLLAGPSSAYWPLAGEQVPLMEDFLVHGGDLVDVVTWHYYPQQSVRCPLAVRRAGPDVLLVPENLDEVAVWASEVETHAGQHAPAAQIWLGESGNAQCGGEPGVSDAFVGGFWWLDQLGIIARRGHPIVVRQTLSGSNYGIIRDEDLTPNPDYWNSVLWRRLMGTRVLAANKLSDDPMLRTYAHCTRAGAPGHAPGAVTVLVLNLDGDRAADVAFTGLGASGFKAFVMTSDDLQSQRVMLNGKWLEAADDGAVPSMDPRDSASTVRLPAHSYAFVVASEANLEACK